MSKTQELAERVAATLPQKNYQFDPTVIIMIMEAIMQMIQTLMDNCNKTPQETIDTAKDLSFLQKVVLRLRVRKTFGNKAFREFGEDVVNGLPKVFAAATVEEVQAVYDECDAY